MNLDTIPETAWIELTDVAKRAGDVRQEVLDYFYRRIYATYSKGKVVYESENVIDLGWHDVVKAWKDVAAAAQRLGAVLKDGSVGKASVQAEDGHSAADVKMARMWEKYNEVAMKARFQFVVIRGAGMVLFNRMRRACQTCIKDHRLHVDRDGTVLAFCIKGWKVFGEAGQMGRSDSCVVYLTQLPDTPVVVNVVQTYIWPAIEDLVAPGFAPLGFCSVANLPLWYLETPDKALQQQVLGDVGKGSAGALLGRILGQAFAIAMTKTGPTDSFRLKDAAKAEAQRLVQALYPT